MRTRLLAAALVAVLALASACTSTPEPDPIRIGLLTALTGSQKGPGTDIRQGFQLYLDTHGGKLGGREVELVLGDEGEGPEDAVPVATEMIERDRVQVLTGVVTTGVSGAVAPLATEHEIPFVGANGRPNVADGTWVWHTSFLTEDFGSSLGEYMAESVPGPVYAMGMDFPGAREGLRGFLREFTAAGGELANPRDEIVYTPMTEKNYRPYLSKIKRSGAKSVFGFFVAAQGIDYITQYQQSTASELPLYGCGLTEGGNAIDVLGGDARGVYTTFNYAPDLDNAANRNFIAAWDARHPGVIPSGLVVGAYDAGTVLDRAIAAAGPDGGPAEINAAIDRLGKIDSPRGEWEFGPRSHTPVQKWYLRQVRDDGRSLSNVVIQELGTLGG